MLEKISLFFKNDSKSFKILLILFILGIILFSLSEYISYDNKQNEISDTFDETIYTENLESKLTGIISEIKGVSNVKVMVMLDSSESLMYLSEKASIVSKDSSEQNSSVIYKEEKNGGKTPVLSEIRYPEVKGVSVVCTGGSNAGIQSKIINLISSTLNLSKNRIYVTE